MSQWKMVVCIDIISAYFHIPVRQKDQELLAFAVSGMGRLIPTVMGLLNYMTGFILRLAELAKPIREVFQNKRKIDDEIVLKNFKIIQQIITQDPYLKMIEPRKPIKIQTDTSEKATGAVLLQQDNKGIWIPRGYYSYTFTPTEQKWNSTVRKEAKAIANAIKHFQKDLPIGIGQIIIETDSNTLVNMLK